MNEAPIKQHEYPLDTGWMQQMVEWGMHAAPGKRGLTLTEIQIGSYGDVPELSKYMTGRPRVSQPTRLKRRRADLCISMRGVRGRDRCVRVHQ